MSKLRASKIKKIINKGISMNPTTISFTQISKKIVDGGFVNETSDRTITVLIYTGDSDMSGLQMESKIEGTSHTNSKYKMIADSEADLEINPKETVEFENNGIKFEIKAVYPQIVEDIRCGYMCDLERID
ncbi:hypothetical protein [Clostridium beijerinckii]|uniref:hypothetical protein n=1 Tax=Clostridium beijerinckii TaxID=1520 RepID=UPI00232E327D|nr:hypothetical protein [Clostridium beijerinckii]